MKHVEIVKPPAPVSLCSAKDDDVNADSSADLATTLLPRSVFQDLTIHRGVVRFSIKYVLVLAQACERLLDRGLSAIKPGERLQAALFKFARYLLFDFASGNSAQQFGVSVDLRNTKCGVCSLWRVVVVLVVLERFTQGRCAVETYNAKTAERRYVITPR